MGFWEGLYAFAILLTAFVTLIKSVWPPRFCIRNPTALGMVAMWCFGRTIYLLTGEGMPVKAMVIQDMAVIACMFVKADWRDCSPYRSSWQVIRAILWRERTPWDRAILALFPLAWLFYAPIADDVTQYWTLYGIGLVQLALAGWEAFDPWLRTLGQSSRADNERPPGLRFAAWERGYG